MDEGHVTSLFGICPAFLRFCVPSLAGGVLSSYFVVSFLFILVPVPVYTYRGDNFNTGFRFATSRSLGRKLSQKEQVITINVEK